MMIGRCIIEHLWYFQGISRGWWYEDGCCTIWLGRRGPNIRQFINNTEFVGCQMYRIFWRWKTRMISILANWRPSERRNVETAMEKKHNWLWSFSIQGAHMHVLFSVQRSLDRRISTLRIIRTKSRHRSRVFFKNSLSGKYLRYWH